MPPPARAPVTEVSGPGRSAATPGAARNVAACSRVAMKSSTLASRARGKQLPQRRQVVLAQRIHAHPHLPLGARQRHRQILAAGGRAGGGGAVEQVLHRRAHSGGEALIADRPVIDDVQVHDRGAPEALEPARRGSRSAARAARRRACAAPPRSPPRRPAPPHGHAPPSPTRPCCRRSARQPSLTSTPARLSARAAGSPIVSERVATWKPMSPASAPDEQAVLEHERAERERRLGGRQVQRGQRDQIPQRAHRIRALAVDVRASRRTCTGSSASSSAGPGARAPAPRAPRSRAGEASDAGSGRAHRPGEAAREARRGAASPAWSRASARGSQAAAGSKPAGSCPAARAGRGRPGTRAGTHAGRCPSAGHRARTSRRPRPACA